MEAYGSKKCLNPVKFTCLFPQKDHTIENLDLPLDYKCKQSRATQIKTSKLLL